jgi:hypothetical protein
MEKENTHIPDHVDWKKFDLTVSIEYQDGTTETATDKAEGERKSDAEMFVEYRLGLYDCIKEIEIESVKEIDD